MRCLATCSASRVLPEPPVPVRVKSRVMASVLLTSTSSRSRPTKLVLGAGRLCLLGSGGSFGGGPTGWDSGNLPASTISCRRWVAVLGSGMCLAIGESIQAHQAHMGLLKGGLLLHYPPQYLNAPLVLPTFFVQTG